MSDKSQLLIAPEHQRAPFLRNPGDNTVALEYDGGWHNGAAGMVAAEERREATAVGDLNSDAKGTGARKNEGKTPYSLVPITVLAASLKHGLSWDQVSPAVKALWHLGRFQSTHDAGHLYEAIDVLGEGAWADCADVFQYGIKKYKAWNWAKGMAWTIPFECAVRHLLDMTENGMDALDLDKPGAPGSQLPHRGHVMCNLCMLLSYADTFPEGNDLPPKGLLP